jgi:hypothetical protein
MEELGSFRKRKFLKTSELPDRTFSETENMNDQPEKTQVKKAS